LARPPDDAQVAEPLDTCRFSAVREGKGRWL
jgi:hypothetical protein